MVDNDARLRELSNKAVDGAMTDEEFAELAQLSRAKQMLREGRAAMIAGVRETLLSQGIAIQELFSAAEIAAAAPQSSSARLRAMHLKGRQAHADMAAGRLRRPVKNPRPGGSECSTLMQQAMREAPSPLTINELVRAVMAKKSLAVTEEKSLRRAVYYILQKDDSGFAVANPQAKWKRWVVAGEADTHDSKSWSQN